MSGKCFKKASRNLRQNSYHNTAGRHNLGKLPLVSRKCKDVASIKITVIIMLLETKICSSWIKLMYNGYK